MLEHNGKKYARVSEVISPFADFSKIDPIILANKCTIGTTVHQAIADDIDGEFPCPGNFGAGYFESYIKWKKSINPIFIHSEKRYFCDEKMITGQIDCVVCMPGTPLPVLIDFKTSVNESPETWPMQAHLYHYLLRKSGIEVGSTFLFLKLDKKGNAPRVFSYQWSQNIYNKCMKAIDEFWNTDKK